MTPRPLTDASPVNGLALGAPEFSRIRPGALQDSAHLAMAEHHAELTRIASSPEPPTFENTLEALERAGRTLDCVVRMIEHLAGTDSTPELRKIRGALAPLLAGHRDDLFQNEAIFARIETVERGYASTESGSGVGFDSGAGSGAGSGSSAEADGLNEERRSLLRKWLRDFVRAGIRLDPAGRTRLREIHAALASLTVAFQDQLLEASGARALVVTDVADLAGLSPEALVIAREAAKARGLPEGHFLLELVNTTRQPLLALLDDRDTRRRLWEASARRGLGEHEGVDTRPTLLRQAQLRAEKAQLLGFDSWAAYVLDAQVAKTPEAARALLSGLVPAVRARIAEERQRHERALGRMGLEGPLEPWDWAWLAERERPPTDGSDDRFDLERVLADGLFATMEARYGLHFERRDDISVSHPEMRAYVVRGGDEVLGLFYLDLFARPSKRGGAWMSSFQVRSKLLGTRPLIVNVLNVPKPAPGAMPRIDADQITTLFHEMGHGLHGLLSDVTYPSLSGTAVPRDFVEVPSTFEEDWAIQPEVLAQIARDPETGAEPSPETIERLRTARNADQAFDTFEYLAAALLDLAWHMLPLESVPTDPSKVESFERAALEAAGVLEHAIPPRYRTSIFAHIWGYDYAAGYYAYLWSEVMAADAFERALEEGGTTPGAGARYRAEILARGSSREPLESFEAYRGRAPEVGALLRRRGLTA